MKYDNSYVLYETESYKNANYRLKHQKKIRYALLRGKQNYMAKNNINVLGPEKIKNYLKDKGIDLSKATVESLYNPDSDRSAIDISAVILLCEWWQLDVTRVLSLPDTDSTAASPGLKELDSNRKVLSDPKYAGIYYCYFFRVSGTDSSFTKAYPNSLPKREDLIKGTLTISIDKTTGSRATFEYTQRIRDYGKDARDIKKAASCIPYESTANKNVFMEFVDGDGRWYEIIFDHQEFNNSPCYFRIAAMITEAAEKDMLPVFQKMVFFRNKPEETDEPYIRGFLNTNVHNLLVAKSELEALAGVDEKGNVLDSDDEFDADIREFYKYYNKTLSPHLKEIYAFNESVITKSPSDMSEFAAKKALVKLRHHSYSPNQIYIGKDDDAHRVARHLLNKDEQTMADEED